MAISHCCSWWKWWFDSPRWLSVWCRCVPSLVNLNDKSVDLRGCLESVPPEIPMHDIIARNAMILWDVKYGKGQKALELFRQMQQKGMEPDPATLLGVLNVCASVVVIEEGRPPHKQIVGSSFRARCLCVSNSLVVVVVYAENGSLEDAQRVFRACPCLMLLGMPWFGDILCAAHEMYSFKNKKRWGLKPDPVTFVGSWIHVPVWWHLKGTGMFMNICSEWLQVWCVCGQALWSCTPTVGEERMSREEDDLIMITMCFCVEGLARWLHSSLQFWDGTILSHKTSPSSGPCSSAG